jgi:hypothetical protein
MKIGDLAVYPDGLLNEFLRFFQRFFVPFVGQAEAKAIKTCRVVRVF